MKTGWTEVTLGEVLSPVARFESRDDFRTYQFAGTYSYARGIFPNELKPGSSFNLPAVQRIEAGDFIYCKIMAWEGAFGLAGEDVHNCWMSGAFVAFRPDLSSINPRFLHYWFRCETNWRRVAQSSTGTNMRRKSLHPDDFCKAAIRLPPLAEQQRLVALLDVIETHLTRARRLRAEADADVATLFPQMLARAMTPHGSGWKRETIGDVIVSMDAGWSPQCEKLPAGDGQWGVLKTTSVQWGEFRPQHNKALPSTESPIQSLVVQEDDVLVTRAGPRKRVGVVAAVRKDEPCLTISDKLIRLRADRAKIHPRFLELSLASPFSQEHLVQRKTGLADAQVNISQAILKATPIAYPSLPEQARLISRLDAARGSINVLSRHQTGASAQLNALLPSLLDRIFSS